MKTVYVKFSDDGHVYEVRYNEFNNIVEVRKDKVPIDVLAWRVTTQ